MQSFRIAASLLLAGNAVAALSRSDCFAQHSNDLAEYTDCGNRQGVSDCLSQLSVFDHSHVEACFIDAGCAAADAAYVMSRCDEYVQTGELRRRYRAAVEVVVEATPTVVELKPRQTESTAPKKSGTECFTTSTITTSSCALATVAGQPKTQECVPTQIAASECAKGLICTVDSQENDICMDAHNSLDTGGIIISIVFASFVVLCIGYLTFACCRERSHHKKMAAKAEAVALARAATRKQRSQEARAPLMQQTQETSEANPFQEQGGRF